jgi:hypothetical protein
MTALAGRLSRTGTDAGRRTRWLLTLLACCLPALPGRAAEPVPAADPATDLTFAYSTRGCGPIDQPVTLIYLTHERVRDGSPQPPYVQIWFAHGLDENGRFSGRWDGPLQDVGGTWCRTPQECSPVPRGSLSVQRSTADGTLNGEIELDLHGPVGGPLSAEPLPSERLSCG